MDEYHAPVLVREVIEGLNIRSGKKYIDATVGGAGHAIEIVKRGGILLGIDTDPDAIAYAKERLRDEKGWTLVQGNFWNIEKIAKENGFSQVDGVLLDLGVSSHQIDTGTRGFSYRFDAPLDLRMNPGVGESASELLNRLSEEELYELFAKFGEEAKSHELARAVRQSRTIEKIRTTGQLVAIIDSIITDKRKQPAVLSRIFQALRIAVNDEMSVLDSGLIGAKKLLRKGGRLIVLSFHSLEDRKVKLFLRGSLWRLITKKPMVATKEEIAQNPRARSAKLRIAEKL